MSIDSIQLTLTCLNHYNNNNERLVNALCDGTVPEHLQFEAQSTTTSSVASAKMFTNEDENENENVFPSENSSMLEQRSNIYDNDEFDIFNRDNFDITRIHRGKKTRDALEVFNDKSHLEGMSERYSRLGIVEDETDGEYDDEYDDTYDDGIVAVRDKADTIDNELEKNENRLFGKKAQHFRQQTDDDDDDDDGENNQNRQDKSRIPFVENPEAVRERRAQQRAAWQQRHQPHRSHTEEKHDVVGNARGRGQSTTVAHNRRWKDAHKSAHGNHNRRDRAAQKSNRGLLS
ncbi:unnamed protein product [Rotaria magnacalcarata]|uniref:Uncharacterized protein n=2 Tax=Rotaria magnacalcarata TaxID=392030 RepID=A0A816SX91_9BILA|nr:unnamed protein product [Rotaria magnacalcarata]CAF1630348.1 unnamed protein product [Rotaria magnacalcarata]CAF2089022.1 unnamed protein product [Rotaria magnacalcarata]CAF3974500.1 unnamed protein product [Rotaria magnacalcarata]CAF4034570.1 unnamed protein product [Rotaria magnacalcarata]